MNQEEKEKLKLLNEIKVLTSCQSPRRPRSDKGRIRGPNAKVRSDKGQPRLATKGIQKEPMTIYLLYKAKLFKPDNQLSMNITTDINGIYEVLVREPRVINKNHVVVHQHTVIARTVKYVARKTIDLEQYRFNALQSIAEDRPFTDKEQLDFHLEISLTLASTPLELFVRLYHIKEEEYIRWSYKRWREDYDLVVDEIAIRRVTLEYGHRPGSPEFMPEVAYRLEEELNVRRLAYTSSKEYVNLAARVRDEEYSLASDKIRRDLLKDESLTSLSLAAIDKLVRAHLDQAEIDKRINDRLSKIVDDYVNKEER